MTTRRFLTFKETQPVSPLLAASLGENPPQPPTFERELHALCHVPKSREPGPRVAAPSFSSAQRAEGGKQKQRVNFAHFLGRGSATRPPPSESIGRSERCAMWSKLRRHPLQFWPGKSHQLLGFARLQRQRQQQHEERMTQDKTEPLRQVQKCKEIPTKKQQQKPPKQLKATEEEVAAAVGTR